ncbi:hypothetical protein ABK040_008465 [Willaertia magna]
MGNISSHKLENKSLKIASNNKQLLRQTASTSNIIDEELHFDNNINIETRIRSNSLVMATMKEQNITNTNNKKQLPHISFKLPKIIKKSNDSSSDKSTGKDAEDDNNTSSYEHDSCTTGSNTNTSSSSCSSTSSLEEPFNHSLHVELAENIGIKCQKRERRDNVIPCCCITITPPPTLQVPLEKEDVEIVILNDTITYSDVPSKYGPILTKKKAKLRELIERRQRGSSDEDDEYGSKKRHRHRHRRSKHRSSYNSSRDSGNQFNTY